MPQKGFLNLSHWFCISQKILAAFDTKPLKNNIWLHVEVSCFNKMHLRFVWAEWNQQMISYQGVLTILTERLVSY